VTFTTPLPWHAESEDGVWRVISDVTQLTVAYVGHDSSVTAAGDAHLIEVACNAFDPLVAALETLVWRFESFAQDASHLAGDEDYLKAIAALQLARKEARP